MKNKTGSKTLKLDNMKMLFFIILLTVSTASFSQTKPVQPRDTAWLPASDTVEYISERDINEILQIIGNQNRVTPVQFMQIRSVLEMVITNAIDRKRGKKK